MKDGRISATLLRVQAKERLDDYIYKHENPGTGLIGLIVNDLAMFVRNTGPNDVGNVGHYYEYMNTNAKAKCWGSRDKYNQWVRDPCDKI